MATRAQGRPRRRRVSCHEHVAHPGASVTERPRRRSGEGGASAAVRGRSGRAAPRLAAVRAGGRRHGGRHGLPDRATPSTCRCSATTSGSRPGRVHRTVRTTSPCCTSPYWWEAFWNTVIITVRVGGHRARARHGAGRGDAPHDLRTRPGADLDPHPVRHRHRGGRLQLAVRLDAEHGLPVDAVRRRGAAHRPVAGHRRDHPGRGVEDDAVHGPAAHGRAGPRAGGPAEGGQGRRGVGVAALHRASRCR